MPTNNRQVTINKDMHQKLKQMSEEDDLFNHMSCGFKLAVGLAILLKASSMRGQRTILFVHNLRPVESLKDGLLRHSLY